LAHPAPIDNGAGDLLSVPAMTADGRRISVEFTIMMLKDVDGRVDGVAAICAMSRLVLRSYAIYGGNSRLVPFRLMEILRGHDDAGLGYDCAFDPE
jgi:hypothetical protein